VLKTNEAVAILSRLGEKGILNKSALKEINKDIKDFLKDSQEANIPINKNYMF